MAETEPPSRERTRSFSPRIVPPRAVQGVAMMRPVRQSREPASDDDESIADEGVTELTLEGEPHEPWCDILNLYQGPDSRWTKQCPELHESTEDKSDQKKAYALTVFHTKSNNDAGGLHVHSIVVHSTLLKQVLQELFQGFEGIASTLNHLQFQAPFRHFFYQWDQLETTAQDHPDSETRSHIKLLHGVLKKELSATLSTHKDFVEHSVVTYEYLWTLFKPGELVYSSEHGHFRAFRVVRSTYERRRSPLEDAEEVFLITCEYMDWDGRMFGAAQSEFEIKPFDGTCLITKLDVVPVAYHESSQELRERLLVRGRRFCSLSGFHHKAYDGFFLAQEGIRGFFVNTTMTAVHGRIIVDTETYRLYNREDAISVTDRRRQLPFPERRRGNGVGVGVGSNPSLPKKVRTTTQHQVGKDEKKDGTEQPQQLSDEQLLICSLYVRGYSLRKKSWGQFFVDHVRDIDWKPNIIDDLLLPNDFKDLILAFVRGQLSQDDDFDDIIEGKGKGFIMLFSGNPGVGKTLTAECIAEEMKAPIYSITSADLGEDAATVERKLLQILDLATRWKAVLLFDECDVFLESRSRQHMNANAIIATFLRTLEYYKGVLLLTTIRLSSIDPAFQSRIHLTLDYPDLDPSIRRDLWFETLVTLQEWHLAGRRGYCVPG
ncbi:ATPase, AAA-type, core [Metarhizium rileyi]|uniref:ATPase, AAA-type, core n=1 Tax=Metarhizium rileyi (strain RCEF 4871) TaxID=1649241 RepID=A0A166WL20_METRR|nr:ATPase, AAA-type, core [Metarhizium rileyi RCEF 4871]